MSNRSWEELREQMERLSFSDKFNLIKKMNDTSAFYLERNEASAVRYNGYLTTVEDKGVRLSGGDYYVYLWKHAWGDPFYVGSGKGDRWTSKGGRCDEFYLHLDSADAIVYLILSGVDSKTARVYERYVSANITDAGYTLTNGDNNAEYKSKEARDRLMARCKEIEGIDLTRKVESAVLNIVSHKSLKVDYRITDIFQMEYGTDFFSRNYVFNKAK